MPSTPSAMRWGERRSVRRRGREAVAGVRHILIDARYATAPCRGRPPGSILVLAPNVIWWAAVSEPVPLPNHCACPEATPPLNEALAPSSSWRLGCPVLAAALPISTRSGNRMSPDAPFARMLFGESCFILSARSRRRPIWPSGPIKISSAWPPESPSMRSIRPVSGGSASSRSRPRTPTSHVSRVQPPHAFAYGLGRDPRRWSAWTRRSAGRSWPTPCTGRCCSGLRRWSTKKWETPPSLLPVSLRQRRRFTMHAI